MLLRYIGVVLIFVLCVQVIRCNPSLSRVLERLDVLEGERSSLGDRLSIVENKLSREQRHRREDVESLNKQLVSLRQTCGCDTSQSVTPGQVLAKTQTVEGKSLANGEQLMMANLRVAFKEEKRENTRIRSELTQKYGMLEGDVRQALVNVTKNIMNTQQDLVEKHRDLVQNVTRVLDVMNSTVSSHIRESVRSIGQFKEEMDNKVVHEVSNVKRSIEDTERRLMDTQSHAVENVKVLIKNTEQTTNQTLSRLKRSIETCQQQVNQKSKSIVALEKTLLHFKKLTGVQDCPRSEYASGVYFLKSTSPILDKAPVYCDTKTDGGGWLVFQRRQGGTVDFFRNWMAYKQGFGNLTTEFWWGLEKLHAATRDKPRELRVELEAFSGYTAYAHYTSFSIASESDKYALSVSGYSGTAGDSLAFHNGKPFSTKDRDHDTWSGGNCAVQYTGAWWFDACRSSHLNGKYQSAGESFPWSEGPVWRRFNGYWAVKFAEMKLR